MKSCKSGFLFKLSFCYYSFLAINNTVGYAQIGNMIVWQSAIGKKETDRQSNVCDRERCLDTVGLCKNRKLSHSPVFGQINYAYS